MKRCYRDEWITHARKHTGFAIGNPPEVSTFCNTDPSWDMELAEFVDCVRTGAPIRNGTSNDAYETMRMVFAIYEADEMFMAQQAGKPSAKVKADPPKTSPRPRKPAKAKSRAG